ncbi:MAG TPA: nucleotide exchange factor GrpE [Pyrinomonadaceae bacterium]|nr:nucleotide exchange factor GrpE [Pyrinomonadaceae bacterium]
MQEQAKIKDMRKEDNPAAEDNRATGKQTASHSQPNDSAEVAAETAHTRVSPAYVAELEARTQAAEQQTSDVRSCFEQLRAELQRQTDETRQRLNRAADERALGSKAEFVAALLPILDNLQRSLAAARESGSKESLLSGLEGTVRGFESALAGIGVEPVRSVGEMFDPAVHEAVNAVDVGNEEDGIVTREYSKGYKLGERLLRPSRVQVGRASTA